MCLFPKCQPFSVYSEGTDKRTSGYIFQTQVITLVITFYDILLRELFLNFDRFHNKSSKTCVYTQKW